MTKKIVAMMGALLLLTSCQLAKPEAEQSVGDRLVGVFITKEHLDLFDMEGYLNDNLSGMTLGGKMRVEGDTTPYEGRLYATLQDMTHTNGATGEPYESQEFIFEGVEGFRYIAATMQGREDLDSYVSSMVDEGLSTSGLNLSYGDDKDSIKMEATLYVAAGQDTISAYFNPVYQSADGRVYLTAGSGTSLVGNNGAGDSFTHKMTESTTITEEGVSKSAETEIVAHLTVMNPPQRTVLLQMGVDSEILAQESYLPNEMPTKLTLGTEVAYVVVEVHSVDFEGMLQVTYEIYDREDDGVMTFAARDDGICVPGYTALEWAGK